MTTTRIGIWADYISSLGLESLIAKQEGFHCLWITSENPTALLSKAMVDILVVDFDSASGGLSVLGQIAKNFRLSLITMSRQPISQEVFYHLEQMGVKVFCRLPKIESEKGIPLMALQAAMLGGSFYDPLIGKRSAEIQPEKNLLTRREAEVLMLLGEGLSCKEVAARLGTALKTVECQKFRLMKKLNLRNKAELVRHVMSLPIDKVTPINVADISAAS
jgi:two-component system response regulator NreC